MSLSGYFILWSTNNSICLIRKLWFLIQTDGNNKTNGNSIWWYQIIVIVCYFIFRSVWCACKIIFVAANIAAIILPRSVCSDLNALCTPSASRFASHKILPCYKKQHFMFYWMPCACHARIKSVLILTLRSCRATPQDNAFGVQGFQTRVKLTIVHFKRFGSRHIHQEIEIP